jgi:hypothetical protein
MPRTTSNIHRAITLAAVTVATAITFSTIARADDDSTIRQDATNIQQDRQDNARDTQKLFQDAVSGGNVGHDIRRLQEDSQDAAQDRSQFKHDVDRAVGDPGDVDAMARTKDRGAPVHQQNVTTAPMRPQNVTTQRPQSQK